MTSKDTMKLIELLRVFINSPCRTKADAEVLEAKLAEFEKEIAKPEKRDFVIIQKPIRDYDDMDWYHRQLVQRSNAGYKIESCGINGSASEHRLAWAILSGPEEADS